MPSINQAEKVSAIDTDGTAGRTMETLAADVKGPIAGDYYFLLIINEYFHVFSGCGSNVYGSRQSYHASGLHTRYSWHPRKDEDRQWIAVQLVKISRTMKEERFSASTRNAGATEFQWSGRKLYVYVAKSSTTVFTEGKDPKEAVYRFPIRPRRTAQQDVRQRNYYSTDASQRLFRSSKRTSKTEK